MKRRDFIKLLCAAGIAVPMAPWLVRIAEASTESYGGPLLLFIQAYGGWDPVQFCDPKGDLGRGFGAADVQAAGGIKYAPMTWLDGGGYKRAYNEDFFPPFHRRMFVVQGINMQTNIHNAGTINSFQGNFASGFPTLSAAFCAARSPSLLLGYLVTGSYRSTGGLLPYTAINNPDFLRAITLPNEGPDLGNNIAPERIPGEVLNMIDSALQSQVNGLLADKTLMPRRRRALNQFLNATANNAGLERLGHILPADGLRTTDEFALENVLVKQSDIVLHAMAAGLTAAADLQFTGETFDSHDYHVTRQGRMLARLVYGIRFIWRRAEELDAATGSNIADRLTIVIHSEFGRTPHFNSDGGTDHWPTTSAIIMRKDFETTGIGSRTVGYSTNDGRYQPGRINPVTLEPDESGGIELTSAHLHKALREYLGIADSPVLARFGFPGVESVNMFTPGLATPQT